MTIAVSASRTVWLVPPSPRGREDVNSDSDTFSCIDIDIHSSVCNTSSDIDYVCNTSIGIGSSSRRDSDFDGTSAVILPETSAATGAVKMSRPPIYDMVIPVSLFFCSSLTLAYIDQIY